MAEREITDNGEVVEPPTKKEADLYQLGLELVKQGKAEQRGNAFFILPPTDPEEIRKRQKACREFDQKYDQAYLRLKRKNEKEQFEREMKMRRSGAWYIKY